MPDRVTNTINVADKDEPVCRPAVINMYDGDLSSVTKWWKQWTTFMFSESLLIKTSEGNVEQKPYEMLKGIKKSKYPAITEVSSYVCYFPRKEKKIDPFLLIFFRTKKKFLFRYKHYVVPSMILSSFT